MSKLDELNQKYGIGNNQESSYTGSDDSASSSALSALNQKYGIGLNDYITTYRNTYSMPNNAGTNAQYFNTFGWNNFTRSGNYSVPLPSMNQWRSGDLTLEQRKILDASRNENMYYNDYQRVKEAAEKAGIPFGDYVSLFNANGVRLEEPSWGNWSAAQEEVDQAMANADKSVAVNNANTIPSLEEISSLEETYKRAEQKENDAYTALGYVSDPWYADQAQNDYQAAKAATAEAKKAWEDAQAAYDAGTKAGATTSGSYDVAKQYSDKAVQISKGGEYDQDVDLDELMRQRDEARTSGNSALEYELTVKINNLQEEIDSTWNKDLATAQFESAYASAYQWDDYITAAQADPETAMAGLAKSEQDLATYLDNAESIFDTNEVNKLKHEHPTDEWTDEQKLTFGWMFDKDPQKAAEYATQINSGLDAQKRAEEEASLRTNEDGTDKKFGPLDWLKARYYDLGAIGDFLVNAYEYLDVGTITSKDYLSPSQRAQIIDSAISENLNEKSGTLPDNWFAIGGKGLGDVYQMGNSVLMSTIAGLSTGGGWLGSLSSGAMFFGPAASNAYYQAVDQGASPGQAVVFGLASGTFEMLFEEISLDKVKELTKYTVNTPSKNFAEGVLKWARSVGISAFIEGDEEINTSIANWIGEAVILQDKSQSKQKILDLMANEGLTYDDAWLRVFKENCEDIAYDGIVGGISGAIHTGAYSTAEGIYNTGAYDNSTLETGIQGQTVTPGSSSELIDYAEKYGDADLASMIRTNMDKRMEKGKPASITRGEAKQLAASITPDTYRKGATTAAAVKKGVQGVSQLVDEQARGKGGLKAQTEDVSVDLDGESMTLEDIGYGNKEKVRLKDSNGNIITKTIDEVMDKLPEATQTLITWAKDVLGEGYARAVYLYDQSQDISVEEYVTGMNTAAAIASTGADIDRGSSPLLAHLTDKQLRIAEMIGHEQHQREIENAEKRQQEYEAAKVAAEEAIQTGDVKAAQEEISQIETSLGYAQEEHDQAVEALEGMEANTEEYNAQKDKVKAIQQQINEIKDFMADRKADLAKLIKQVRFTARKAGTVSYGGGILDGKKVNAVTGPITQKQQNVVNMVNALADVFNFDYVFFDGDARGTQGAYVGGGKIFININAGGGSKMLAASTLGHELTHALQDYAGTKYEELAQYIEQSYKSKYGTSKWNQLIENKLAAGYRREDAINEIVANSCSEMLLNSKTIQNLAQENSSLFEEIRTRIGDIVAKIKAAYGSDTDTGHAEVELARAFEDLQKYWDEAAAAAIENKTNMEIAGQTISSEDAKTQYLIFESMTEDERYEELKSASLTVIPDTRSSNYSNELSSLQLVSNAESKAKKIIIPLAEKLGIINKEMSTPEVDVNFLFSKNGGLTESLNKQQRYGGDYVDFARALINLEDVLNNAKLIEVHQDKYKGTRRENPNLINTSVLFGAFRDTGSIIPVQFEIKNTSDTGGRLYLTVALTKINADVFGRTSGNKPSTSSLVSADYSLADIIKEINPQDKHFLKYIPDQMLSDVQIKAKIEALAEDKKRIESYKESKPASENKKNTQEQRYSEAAEDVGISIDEETESANPDSLQFSRLSWEESEYYRKRDEAAEALAKSLDVSVEEAEDYIDSINSVARMIGDNQARLDYTDTGLSPFVSNAEYGGSFDFTTLCKKRRLLTGTFSAIQKALPNTALTANEILQIRKMMDDAGLEVSCGKCYVEGSRASMGLFTKEFINLYKKYNPGTWAPDLAEMNTPDGIEWVRQNHPEVYSQYEYFWNHYGTLRPGDPNLFASQQKPKLYQMRSAYKGEILDSFRNSSTIAEKNKNGGVRLQSFSDFEIVHLIDAMQVIMDMSRVGLNGQAYTKVPDFAWALGLTGLKINLSIDAWSVGEDGKLVFNNKEGMNFDEAMRIRAANSKNVGTICCVYDDAQLLAALADDRIDFIIPFHRSQWKKAQYKAMGLPATTKDYTYQQNEKWLNPKAHTHEYRGRQVPTRCTNYMPNEYWDFSKTGKENAEEYLRMCARDGKRPKFYKFLTRNSDGSFSLKEDGSTDGYWKLLIDFKMYDNEGNGSPQMPVRPDFNMDEVNRMLTEYEGGHEQFPVAHGIVDQFVDQYKNDHPREQYQRWAEQQDQTSMELRDNQVAQNRLQVENTELKNLIADLNRQIKELTADAKKKGQKIDDLKRQMQTTDRPEVREADARKMANQLIREYHSNIKADELAADIKALGDYLVQNTGETLDYTELYDMAETIADKVITNAYGLLEDVTGEKQIYKEIASIIKDRKFWLPENMRGELDVLDGYNKFRRKNFGRFKLGEGGESIDSFYEEMQDSYGKLYFPDVNAQGEMLIVMSEIFDQARDEYGNPFAQDQDQITAELANTILGDAISENLRQVAPTLADKQQAKIKALQARNKARMDALRQQKNERIADVYRKGIAMRDQALAKERAAKYEKIEALKKHYAAKEQRAAERRNNSRIRVKIRKLINDLNARLKSPNQKKYVPVEFVQATVDLLNMINLDTGRSESLSAKLGQIRNMYDSYKQNDTYSVAYDETMSDMLKELAAKIGDTPLHKMTADQLGSVYNALKSLHYVINNAVKVRIMEDEYNAFDLSRTMTQETRSVPKAQSNAFTKWLTAHLRADVMFSRLGGFVKNSTWDLMARMLNDGQLKQTLIQMRLSAGFAELINDSKAMQHFTGTTFAGKINQKDLVDIGLQDENGNAIQITHDMMVGIYLDLLNEENARHFMYGGKTIPDLQKFYSGKGGFDIGAKRAVGIAGTLSNLRHELSEANRMGEADRAKQIKDEIELTTARGEMYVQGIRKNIESKLTAFDRKWIQATQQLMNQDSKRYLNETTMEVYGIEKANVPNYFPIITDRNFLNTPFESITKDMNLENVGFMKERVTASNPTYAMGTFTVVNNQINKVAQYCGLMPAIRSFNKVYNKSGFGYSDSLKQALTEKFGKEGTQYVENLIADLTGSRKEEQNTLTQILGKLRGNLAQTSLTLNPRVALSQAASYPTAAAELGWGPLMKAFAKGGKNGRVISRADTELIAKYSPLLWLRMQGYADVELGDIKNSNNLSSKVWKKMRWATGWIQAVDGATIGRLWSAAEYWVQDNVKNVQVGTDEYYQEVAKKFNDVVEKTQPNYTTMQRAAVLRDPNSLTRTFTMFMTQRLQNFNVLYNSVASYQRMRADKANGRNGVTTRDVQMAQNDMIRAVSSQLAQTATYVGFKFLADALLHGLDAYRDKDDDELTVKSISLQLLNNYVDAMIGMFIAGSELYTIIKAAAGIDKFYGLSVNGVDTFNDIITDTISAINSWKDYDPENEKSVQKLEKSMFTFAKSFSQTIGLPLNNAVKIGNALTRHIQDIANGEFLSFNAGFEVDKDAVGIRMVNALKAGDKDKFDTYADTYGSTSSIYSAVEKQVKDGYQAKKQTITKQEAIDLLVDAGEPKRTAEKKVQQWTCKLATGIDYDKIDDQFVADKISEDRAAELYVTYGGMTKADAKSYVQQIKCEKATGVKYSAIKSEYLAGNLTDAQVKAMLKAYGGKSEDAASKTVLKYSFEKDTEYSWDDKAEALYAGAVSDSKLAGYIQKISPTTYGTKEKADNYVRYLHFQHDYPRYADLSESNVKAIYEAKDASGLSMQQAIDYQIKLAACKGTDKDGDGKTDTNSLRDAKIKMILALPYDYETKLKLFKLSYTSKQALDAFKKAAGK